MLAIITTHPIQYQVPIWQEMAKQGIAFEVWYLTDFGTKSSFDVQFGKSFAWDMDMLSGYTYRFLKVNKGAAPNRGFKNLRLTESLIPLFREYNITHVWINGWQVLAYWQAAYFAKRANLVCFLRAETNDIKPNTWWKNIIRTPLLKYYFSIFNYFLCIGKANRRFYKSFGIEDHKLLDGNYCVDNRRFQNQFQDLAPLKFFIREEFKIPSDKFCILFSGKFIEKKRPLDIVKALQVMNDEQRSKFHLLFVGSGELANDLLNSCNVKYNLLDEKNVAINANSSLPDASFLGFMNQGEIAKAYIVADVLVLPSNYGETWGLVVNEAMNFGLPAIVSNQCGCAEDLIIEGKTGYIFDCGNIEDLKFNLLKLLNYQFDSKKVINHIENYSLDIVIQSAKQSLAR